MLYPIYNHPTQFHNANIIKSSSQSSSSCSQCKRNNYNIQQESVQEDSSMLLQQQRSYNNNDDIYFQQGHQREMKLKRNQRQVEEIMKMLRYEVDLLKRQNVQKDRMILELKLQAEKLADEETKSKQQNRQLRQINRLKQELGCSPRNSHAQFQSGFIKQFDNTLISKQPGHEFPRSPTNKNYFTTKQQNLSNPFHPYTSNNPTALQSLSDYEQRIAFLQRQLQQAHIQNEVQKQFILKLQEENKWQQKFINSFVKMCDELSYNYGEKLMIDRLGQDLKKITKISWNYMKDLVAFFIKAIQENK